MRRRILIVEDTEDNLRIARDLLSSAGYDLLEATDGAAAVTMAALHHPDLIPTREKNHSSTLASDPG